MTFNFLNEKYKNVFSEEEFVNDYSYQKPENLKYKELTKFKKPKLYHINRNIENFESLKTGSRKTLQEFQNLFIQKFIISNIHIIKNKDNIKKSLSLYTMKEKLKRRNKIIKSIETNKEKEEAYTSLMKILKKDNKAEKIHLSHSRKLNYLNRLHNVPQSSSRSIRKSTFNLTGKNKHLSYQFLKRGEFFLDKKEKTPQRNPPIKIFQEKSRLALLKQISAKIIKENLNQKIESVNKKNKANKFNKRSKSNYQMRKIPNMKNNFKSEKSNKTNFDSDIQNKCVNRSNNIKFYEMTKKGCNFSDIIIVEKKKYPNSRKKIKKIERKIPFDYLTNIKRPLSSLERYYIKYGAFL